MKKYLLTAIAFGLFLQWGVSSLNLSERTQAYADSRDAQLNSVMGLSEKVYADAVKQALVLRLASESGCEKAVSSLSRIETLTASALTRWQATAKTSCALLRDFKLEE